MDRRTFISSTCQLCAAAVAAPALLSLESCASSRSAASAFTEQNGELSLPLTELERGPQVLRPKGLEDPLWLAKGPDGAPVALVLRCPHKGGPVKAQAGVLTCGWHGSTFAANGAVTKGPSKDGLKQLPARLEDGRVVVRLQG